MDVCRRTLRFSCVFLLAFLVVAASGRAEAADGDPVQKVTALNKKALEQYARGDYESARELLKQALDVCNNAGLDKHPIRARTHIHFGIVSIVGFKQRDIGIKHFRKAIELQPEIKLTKTLVTPELQDAFEEAQLASESGGGAGAAPAAEGGDQGGSPPVAQSAEGGGAATAEGEEGEAPPPVARRRPPPPKKKKVKRAEEEDQSDQGDEDEDAEGPSYKVYIALAMGTGFGLASGNGELNSAHKLASSGFAVAQLGQITPEVGFFLSPSLLLSARLRLQYVSGLTGEPAVGNECGSDHFCTPGTFGVAGFVRGSYFFGTSSFRPFVSAELGGGSIRHAQVFPSDTNCGPAGAKTQCVDSLKGGPFLFGPALGFLWDFGKTAGLVATLASDIGVPNFTLNFDVNVGLALHF
jgi:hypothetical protein